VQEHDGRILIHNADFDMTVLERAGFPLDWAKVIDTMLAMRIAESDQLAGLKEASNRHLDPEADLSQKDLKQAMVRNGWTWDTIPINLPVFTTYAGWDVVLTSRLYELPIVQDAIASPPWQLEMDTARVCARMSENGMRVDLDMCETQRGIMRSEATAMRESIVASHDLNVGSNPDVSRWFMSQPESRELMTKKTKGGGVSVDVEVLEKIIANAYGSEPASVAEAILAIRRREKLASSYFDTFIERADADSLVHASILPSEAKTGRMQIRNPALQTLPKDGASGVRNVVLPRREGEALITADYDQIEMRLAAVFSRDAGLIKTFEEADRIGPDFFTAMGRQIYHDPLMEKGDPRRHKIKSTMYGTAYGAGPNKIAVTAKISRPSRSVTTSSGPTRACRS
jgi:DNA polymerase-1